MIGSAERHLTVTAEDGVEVHAWLAAPPNPTAGLVLCHGLTMDRDEGGAFTRLRDRALRAGLAVVRFDFRAHGLSGGTNEHFRLEGMRRDVDAVAALLEAEIGAARPLIALGLSFGGAAAVHLAVTAPGCVGLALWYPVVDYEWNYGDASPVAFSQQMRASRQADDPEWSAMPVTVQDFHFPRGLMEEMRADRTLEGLSRLSCPVLAYHGARDPFVDPEPLRRLAATHPNIDLRMLPGAGHGYFLWRPWVIRRTVAWASALSRK